MQHDNEDVMMVVMMLNTMISLMVMTTMIIHMMMSITLKVRVRPEDSGKQMICQVKKTNHENLHIFLFVPIYFGSYISCSGGDPRC